MSTPTKSFNQTVLERARADRDYRIGLLEEAVGLYKSGEDAAGLKMVEQFLAAEGKMTHLSALRGLVNAAKKAKDAFTMGADAYERKYYPFAGPKNLTDELTNAIAAAEAAMKEGNHGSD